MSTDGRDKVEYFYNVRTRMVEKGRLSNWDDLMGPYATREEAERAFEIAKERSSSWDDDDARWSGDKG
ncbi:SPOR domain-containing protein [Demequina capsici]|uniref:SPOR domain-containing protein n=1 Tax=Demequina capsici TaxID=3075620 RepID=A0AA96JH03_9MICO|nr:SPOR domain-containing protein [Demequina sp. PMTSA13]WNM28514.1 SPOR domain-containing protein [Demequina sp. PMTSA13]